MLHICIYVHIYVYVCVYIDVCIIIYIWIRKWQPTPVFLPGESHGQRSLSGYSPWGHKELDATEQACMSNNLTIYYFILYINQ